MPIAIVLNFRDFPASQRLLRIEELQNDCELTWGLRKPIPVALEASMLNCYGLQVRVACQALNGDQ
eukprot:5308883-Pyramimonas_sp.AAC.1